jgi:hypothetical protein
MEETTMIEPPPDEVGNRVTDRQERSGQVDRYRLLPFVKGQVVDGRPHTVDTGVRHNDIKPAETPDQFIDRIAHLIFLGNVSFKLDGIVSRCRYLLNKIVKLTWGTSQGADRIAFCRKCQSRGAAYS